jgi:hypothetical protein
VLAGEVEVANRRAFGAGDRRELPGSITGIGSLSEWIGRPVLEVNAEKSIGVARGGSQGAGKNFVQVV